MATLHIRVPDDLKKALQAVAEANGLDISSLIRMFLQHVKTRGTIPLEPLTVNGYTEAEEKEILRRMKEPSIKAKSVDDLFDTIFAA